MKIIINKQKGQSIVELVFAIGVVALVLTGAMVLLLSSLAAQSKKFDRKKASELAQIVIEDKVAEKTNNPAVFWQLNEISPGAVRSGFDGFTYSLDLDPITAVAGCPVSPISCVEATVRVVWQRDTSKNLEMKRFFSRL